MNHHVTVLVLILDSHCMIMRFAKASDGNFFQLCGRVRSEMVGGPHLNCQGPVKVFKAESVRLSPNLSSASGGSVDN